jgi:hypothetical protein
MTDRMPASLVDAALDVVETYRRDTRDDHVPDDLAAAVKRLGDHLGRIGKLSARAAARGPIAPGLPYPGDEQARATAGCLLHWVASSRGLMRLFAEAIEHHPGDLDDDVMLAYLTATHEVIEYECNLPVTVSLDEMRVLSPPPDPDGRHHR